MRGIVTGLSVEAYDSAGIDRTRAEPTAGVGDATVRQEHGIDAARIGRHPDLHRARRRIVGGALDAEGQWNRA